MDAAIPIELDQQITKLAAQSRVAQYEWDDRGQAPVGYIKGMALCYARVYLKLRAGDVAAIEMAKAVNLDNGAHDALAHYDARFRRLGMHNFSSGSATLRHLFVLLTGLGMRESSGSFCEGRDRSADNEFSDTAEAGLFQQSWNSHVASPYILRLFYLYSEQTTADDYWRIFHEGVHCSESQLENYGHGLGREFQKLVKDKPAFAVEAAAIGLRHLRGHWGPINRKEVELNPDADALFLRVQELVDSHSGVALSEPALDVRND